MATASLLMVDRGCQLDRFRQQGLMTDVELVSGPCRLAAHKLLLSLHSPYFRTLFQSTGFRESGQDQLDMSQISPTILQDIVTFLYTGRLEVEADNCLELLDVSNMLQLQDTSLRDKITDILMDSAAKCESLENLIPIWNTAVLYDLSNLLEAVLGSLEMKLEQMTRSSTDQAWLARLGFEEMKQVLSRPELCVQSEAVLLQLAVSWGKDKVTSLEDYRQWLDLLQYVRVTNVDKSYVKQVLELNFPQFMALARPRRPLSKQPRVCGRCAYLTRYNMTRNQSRNIADFVDSGNSGLVMGFNLQNQKVQRLPDLSKELKEKVLHYFFHHQGKLVVVGDFQNNEGCYIRLLDQTSTGFKCSPRKMFSSPGRLLSNLVQLDTALYLVWTAEKNHADAVLERLDMNTISKDHLIREVVARVPADLAVNKRPVAVATLGSDIYFVHEGGMWKFSPAGSVWTRLVSPMGHLGLGRPVLTGCYPNLYLVGNRPAAGESINCLQTYSPATGLWRRLPWLDTRLTPLDFFSHCGLLFLVAWQRSRLNFVVELDPSLGKVRLVTSGLEGEWLAGGVFRGRESQHQQL